LIESSFSAQNTEQEHEKRKIICCTIMRNIFLFNTTLFPIVCKLKNYSLLPFKKQLKIQQISVKFQILFYYCPGKPQGFKPGDERATDE
jgi:hypothetical protein